MINEILYMEIRLVGAFSERYKLTRAATNRIFTKYNIWQYIESCYDVSLQKMRLVVWSFRRQGNMSSDKMNACADMVLTNAIEDMAMEENISIDEARNKLLDSDACKCLYDFDSKLWMEGSDYFLDFYRMIENKQHIS